MGGDLVVRCLQKTILKGLRCGSFQGFLWTKKMIEMHRFFFYFLFIFFESFGSERESFNFSFLFYFLVLAFKKILVVASLPFDKLKQNETTKKTNKNPNSNCLPLGALPVIRASVSKQLHDGEAIN